MAGLNNPIPPQTRMDPVPRPLRLYVRAPTTLELLLMHRLRVAESILADLLYCSFDIMFS